MIETDKSTLTIDKVKSQFDSPGGHVVVGVGGIPTPKPQPISGYHLLNFNICLSGLVGY